MNDPAPQYNDAPSVGEEFPSRTLPYSIEAETALLGALMVNKNIWDTIQDTGLKAPHFAYGPHGLIFHAMEQLTAVNKNIDPVMLKRHFEGDERITEVGGPKYLMEVAEAAVGRINAKEYARLVRELSVKRDLITLGGDIVDRAYSTDVTDEADAQIEDAEKALSEIAGTTQAEETTTEDQVNGAIKYAEARYQDPNALHGVPTGLKALDSMLYGLKGGELIILAGRPSMGKTTLGTKIATACAETHGPVGFHEFEMSAEQLRLRLISEKCGIPYTTIASGEYQDGEDFRDVINAGEALKKVPLHIDDRAGVTVPMLRARLRRQMRQDGIKLGVVDQLPQIRANDTKAGTVAQLSQITRDMKALAKELGIPILLLHQLSRAVEGRDDKRPMLNDLRDSGSIEQDADVVMFVYRDYYYLERAEPVQREKESDGDFGSRYDGWLTKKTACKNTADVIIAKQRMGPVGVRKVYCDLSINKFADLNHGGDYA